MRDVRPATHARACRERRRRGSELGAAGRRCVARRLDAARPRRRRRRPHLRRRSERHLDAGAGAGLLDEGLAADVASVPGGVASLHDAVRRQLCDAVARRLGAAGQLGH